MIFVDLALAQVAAMGWAAANLGLAHRLSDAVGLPADQAGYAVGLAATLLAAALLSITRMEHPFVSQEAIIGIVYVVASAGTIAFLFTSRRGTLLALAWLAGTAATVLGIVVSYVTDLPTGPIVVCSFALALVVAFALRAALPDRPARDGSATADRTPSLANSP